jgi:hypothetical protein
VETSPLSFFRAICIPLATTRVSRMKDFCQNDEDMRCKCKCAFTLHFPSGIFHMLNIECVGGDAGVMSCEMSSLEGKVEFPARRLRLSARWTLYRR